MFDFGFSKCAQFFADLATKDMFLCIGLFVVIFLLMICILTGVIFGLRSTILHDKDVSIKK